MPCHFDYETKLLKTFSYVAGVDEAGRGALAGPVVVAMVILNPTSFSKEINDSKQLTFKMRNHLAALIKKSALAYSIGVISHQIIDSINILQATYLGVKKCYNSILLKPDHLITDALTVKDLAVEQTSLIKGDNISYSIAAASILAKTTRDSIMSNLSQDFPLYGFAKHKGYGVKNHLLALREYGPCPIHRKSFAPVTSLLKKSNL